jgi:hypothetical protein
MTSIPGVCVLKWIVPKSVAILNGRSPATGMERWTALHPAALKRTIVRNALI